MLVVGRKEAEERTLSIRRLGSDKQEVMSLEAITALLVKESEPPDLASA